MKDKTTERLRYYHSSNNCCGRLLEEPSLITNRTDFDSFLERIREPDILQWAIAQRPNSDWVCEHVTNATFFLNKIVQHPIGCVGIALPDYVKNNKAVVGLERNKQNSIYKDNLCLFRCLALHKGCDVHRLEATVATLYAEYTDMPVRDFAGVKLDDLLKVESKFETNVTVYKLVDTSEETTTAELVRRSECHYPHTMYMNLYETHYSYIHDIGMYCHSYRCRKCGNSLWKWPRDLLRHERTCEAGVNRIYKGGVYHTTPSIFQRLDDEGIVVEKTLRYYPYRATFDFECFFTGNNLPADTKTLQWSARHVPLSVSVASNVPGYEPAQCYVTDGDSDKLVANMMDHLIAISDAAFGALVSLYADVLNELEVRKDAWDEAERKAPKEDDAKQEDDEEVDMGNTKTNPYKTLIGQLLGWLHQLPVIGFNSSQKELVDNVEIKEPLGSSDHNQMYFNINVKSDKTKVKQCRRDFRKGNYKEIRKRLTLIDWNNKMKNKTAAECWNIVRGELDNAIDSYVPMKKQGKRSKKKHLSKEAFRKIRYKQKMWRVYKHTGKDTDYDAYKEALNAATNEVRKSKRNFEHKLAQNIKSDSKSFYAYVRSKQNVRDKVGPLKDTAGNIITQGFLMAEELNMHFSSVFKRENTSSLPVPETKFNGSEGEKLGQLVVTPEVVASKINNMKENKSPGVDGISPKILKEIVEQISMPLAHVFNMSLQEGIVPLEWKEANIIPLFKKGSRNKSVNYRPVSLTSVICKLLETIIRDHMMDFLLKHRLINHSQHGFLKARSCLTNLLCFLRK